PERLARVFDSFGGTDGPARRPGGLHIGLSLSKRMVELHHGTIVPHSAGPGSGSEFVVTLPMLPTAPLPLGPNRRVRSRFSKEALSNVTRDLAADPIRVLIVDDNEAAAKSICELLENNGHRTTVA